MRYNVGRQADVSSSYALISCRGDIKPKFKQPTNVNSRFACLVLQTDVTLGVGGGPVIERQTPIREVMDSEHTGAKCFVFEQDRYIVLVNTQKGVAMSQDDQQ